MYFTTKLQNYTAVENDEVSLLCELSKSVAEVQWFKDGKEIIPSKNIVIQTDGKKRLLTIKKASKADIGEYSCHCGTDKTTASLNIEGKLSRGYRISYFLCRPHLHPSKLHPFLHLAILHLHPTILHHAAVCVLLVSTAFFCLCVHWCGVFVSTAVESLSPQVLSLCPQVLCLCVHRCCVFAFTGVVSLCPQVLCLCVHSCCVFASTGVVSCFHSCCVFVSTAVMSCFHSCCVFVSTAVVSLSTQLLGLYFFW